MKKKLLITIWAPHREMLSAKILLSTFLLFSMGTMSLIYVQLLHLMNRKSRRSRAILMVLVMILGTVEGTKLGSEKSFYQHTDLTLTLDKSFDFSAPCPLPIFGFPTFLAKTTALRILERVCCISIIKVFSFHLDFGFWEKNEVDSSICTMLTAVHFAWDRITSTVACDMDLSKYPMDEQECMLDLESCKGWVQCFI